MSLYWPNEFKNNFDQTKIKGKILIKLTLHNIANALGVWSFLLKFPFHCPLSGLLVPLKLVYISTSSTVYHQIAVDNIWGRYGCDLIWWRLLELPHVGGFRSFPPQIKLTLHNLHWPLLNVVLSTNNQKHFDQHNVYHVCNIWIKTLYFVGTSIKRIKILFQCHNIQLNGNISAKLCRFM